MHTPRVFAILAVYFGLTTAGPLALRQECGGDWECAPIIDTIPTCARPCIADGAAQVGCNADDFECRCNKREEISGLVTNCVLSSCAIEDAIKTIEGTESLCSCVGKNGGPQPACPPAASSSVVAPPASSAAPPASSAAPPASSAPAPPASSASALPSSSAPAPPSYSTGPVPEPSKSHSAPAPPASSAAPAPSCSAAPAPAPAPAGPWKCQSLVDAVHDCAIPCIAEGATSVGCSSDDFTCRCNNAAAISQAATSCVLAACGIATGLEVRQQTADLCTCVAANPPPSGGDETPAPAPVEGCPAPATSSGYPTKPSKDDDKEPVKSKPTTTATVTYPATPVSSTSVKEEPPVVTAGAAKIFGSGAAALLALAVAL